MSAQGGAGEKVGRMARLAGCCLAVVALVTVLANVSLPQADPAKFMENQPPQSRRLFVPDELKNESQRMQGYDILLEHVNRFHGFETDGHKDLICRGYGGIDAPNRKACCSSKCGKYCGREDCHLGPPGYKACCMGSMKHWCGPGQKAPCWVHVAKVADAISRKACKNFKGIDHVESGTCCKPTCGEFCGAKFCKEGAESKDECCARSITNPCVANEAAPCYLPPSDMKYPVANAEPGKELKLEPEVSGAKQLMSFSIKPDLPEGLKLDKETGVIQGTLATGHAHKEHTYQVTAKNGAGEASTQIVLNEAPGSVSYDLPMVKPGGTVDVKPTITGGVPGSFSISPPLPKGLKLDKATGELKGKLSKHRPLGRNKYVVTVGNRAGTKNFDIMLEVGIPTSFPWWILIVAALVLGIVLFLLCRPKKEEELSYVPLKKVEEEPVYVPEPKPQPKPQPPPLPPPPPRKEPTGLPLTFDTGRGEKTVYAEKKPLGLVFDKKMPIKITEERAGSYGRDQLGIKISWILTKVNNIDITGMRFKEADGFLHDEVGKLPGGIPLVWTTSNSVEDDKVVYAFKRPLGLTFDRDKLPIKITKETDGHGKDIGVKVGWILKSINYKDVANARSYKEVENILRDEVGHLPV